MRGGGEYPVCYSCVCTSNPPWNSPVDEPQLVRLVVVGSGGPIFTEKERTAVCRRWTDDDVYVRCALSLSYVRPQNARQGRELV
jgi:hypothetical protein